VRELDDWQKRELLVRATIDETDPIWGQPAFVYETFTGGWVVVSDRAGQFIAPNGLREYLRAWPEAAKARLTSWINDQNRAGSPFPRLTPDVVQNVYEAKPKRFRDKVDQFFGYLRHVNYRPGDYILPSQIRTSADNLPIEHAMMRWTEATGEREWRGLLDTFIAEGLVEDKLGLRLTGKGLSRMDELDAAGAVSDQVFVAMWFGADMNDVFEQGIGPAVQDVGYRPFRIDKKEHANKIDDEIVAEIRRSRFVVADFTCGVVSDNGKSVGIPRGGVYYEAGFAQGLGMPVIWTVREDQIDLVHFDTRQFNHIAWKDADDLRIRLTRRIAAVIGERPAK